MDPAQWLASFRVTHEKAKRGELDPNEREKYVAMRDELARSLVNAQRLTMPDGLQPRRYFRVAQAFPIEINNVTRTVTRDVSCQGFGALVSGLFKEGEQITYSLTLKRGSEPLSGTARVVAAPKQTPTSTRLSCTFEKIEPAKLEELETALFDAALARFT